MGEAAQAQPLYEALLADDNYYSGMAAAHLNRGLVPHPKEIHAQPQVLDRLIRIPAMLRARELFLCGMRPEASAEWQAGYESLTEEARQQAVRLASSWGWYDQAVQVAAAQHIFNDYGLLYPRPYSAEVNAAAQAAQLAPEIVYGVMRQESLYRVDAVSAAGARGLMQLQPGTARRTAQHTNRAMPSVEDLFVPSINTTLGAARLRMLLDEFDGQTPLALAGYNAGVNAVLRWMPPQQMDADIWVENIPYNETRAYVQRVLWHSLLFTWLGDHAAQPTTSWLAPVRPLHPAEDRVASSAPNT
jgi:soluble lytic murein transglycosylase